MTRILLDNSKAARRAYIEAHREDLERLATEGQTPSLMYIGCCDSRVDPEVLLGAGPGDVFVVRTVANIVPPPDDPLAAPIGAALEFGIDVLEIPHLAICGHTDCGGIRAVEKKTGADAEHPHLARWLGLIEILADEPAGDNESPEEHHTRLVQRNVHLQRERIMQYPVVAQAAQANRLKVHAWYFDLAAQRMCYYDAESGQFVSE